MNPSLLAHNFTQFFFFVGLKILCAQLICLDVDLWNVLLEILVFHAFTIRFHTVREYLEQFQGLSFGVSSLVLASPEIHYLCNQNL